MNKVLLTGAAGFIGRSLAVEMQKKDFNLVAAVRQQSSSLPENILQAVMGDITPETDWSSMLDAVSTVIHTAARVHIMNDAATDPLAEFRKANVDVTMQLAKQSATAGVKRFIFLSTIKVNGEMTQLGKPFTADDSPAPNDSYGISKAETEQALLNLSSVTGMEVVIIRPVLVYGAGVKANFLSMMHWLKRGFPLPLGAIHNKRSLIALDNLVDLIIICIDHPAAANQVFLASDGEDLSTTELLQRVGLSLGRHVRLIPVPASFLVMFARLTGKSVLARRLIGSLQVDITKTLNTLEWVPPVNVEEAIDKTVKGFLQQQ